DRVGGLFAAAYLKVVGRKEERRAAELVHAHFKGHARSRGGLPEYHAKRFAFKAVMLYAVFAFVFELVGKIEYADYFVARQVAELKQMFHLKAFSFCRRCLFCVPLQECIAALRSEIPSSSSASGIFSAGSSRTL